MQPSHHHAPATPEVNSSGVRVSPWELFSNRMKMSWLGERSGETKIPLICLKHTVSIKVQSNRAPPGAGIKTAQGPAEAGTPVLTGQLSPDIVASLGHPLGHLKVVVLR